MKNILVYSVNAAFLGIFLIFLYAVFANVCDEFYGPHLSQKAAAVLRACQDVYCPECPRRKDDFDKSMLICLFGMAATIVGFLFSRKRVR
jgi:hypothetical protein